MNEQSVHLLRGQNSMSLSSQPEQGVEHGIGVWALEKYNAKIVGLERT